MPPKGKNVPKMVGPLGESSKTTLRETKEGSHVPLQVNFNVTTGDVRPGPQDEESIVMNTDSHTEENCVFPGHGIPPQLSLNTGICFPLLDGTQG